jgi:hypothetical protein
MRFLATGVFLLALFSTCAAKDEAQVNDLVKKHLDSIGTEQARSATKNCVAEGTLQFRVLNSGGAQDGKQVLVSEGNKLTSLLKLPNPSYHGERFVSDGRNVSIATITPGSYSSFGAFIKAHPEVLTEGLWGGTLSTGWALANVGDRHAKLQDTGLKKVDGKELHQLRYSPSKRSDLEILLFFEPDTGRHVMTSYALTISPQMGMSELENAKQQSTHYLLEERFADFKQSDGLWLPGRWTIQFTADVPQDPNHPVLNRAQTAVSEFAVTVNSISHNVMLDPRNFEIK